ncbi:MAG: 2-succinylbenzoate--CoA ligase [Deltaproteobacteria bacterium]|nr:MAG: 2-succinylbenzoate--CoA ligase [Deltaproteobacteria bacterium]
MTLSVRRAAEARGAAPALVFDSETLTWDEVHRALPAIEREQAALTLVAGRDRATILSIFAAIDARLPFAPLHPRATPDELVAMRAVLSSLSDLSGVPDVPDVPDVQAGGDASDEAPLAYVFTSGSTGAPRAAILSRRAFIASARASADNLAYGPGDRWLLAMPLSHVGGLSVLTRTLMAGATAVVTPEGPMSAEELVRRMAHAEVTYASLVPAMLTRVLRAGLEAPPGLRAVLIGGAPATRALLAGAREAGWPVLPTYGSTETCSQVATRATGDVLDTDGRIGRPLPGVDLRIEDGEIYVRGPMLFDGYIGATSSPEVSGFDDDGYFATGDLGDLDAEGVLWVRGRRSELIITGGENVYPAAVEAVLSAHPEVVEACVYGLPDADWGEVVAAVYRSATGPIPDLDDWLRERLAPHRRPKRLSCVNHLAELPKTSSGKVDRAALRRRALEGSEPDGSEDGEP